MDSRFQTIQKTSLDVQGVWVHTFDAVTYSIEDVLAIQGEVCASSDRCDIFSPEGRIAAIFKGTASAWFQHDCFSDFDEETGLRFASPQRINAVSLHDEAWIVPCQCELIGVACLDNELELIAQLVAEKKNIPLLTEADMFNLDRYHWPR